MPSCSIQPSFVPATGTWYLNAGSCGHPEMCRKPCRFFLSGSCRAGFSCTYCHLDHERRKPHLHKHARELLLEMEAPTCLRMLLRVMRDRVPSLRFSAAAGDFLDTLESLCGRLINATDAGIQTESGMGMLVGAVRGLLFGSMIALVIKKFQQLEPCVVTRIEEALDKLHADIRASELAADEAASRIQGQCNVVDETNSMLWLWPMETLSARGVRAESSSLHQSDFALGPEERLASDGATPRMQAVPPVAFGNQHLAFRRNHNKIELR
eukprot:TRINITY_DN8034_c0_g1_i1.p1 TRINITY_DN8034_c0_g1~~TRINITY_DN8034_c0_g1_i1.p1  ORF type:complete len:268 (-),score=42.12 TRINITY_DN8034_c0_g1_i1:156-959(-)